MNLLNYPEIAVNSILKPGWVFFQCGRLLALTVLGRKGVPESVCVRLTWHSDAKDTKALAHGKLAKQLPHVGQARGVAKLSSQVPVGESTKLETAFSCSLMFSG